MNKNFKKIKRDDYYAISYIAMFGTFWGVVEMLVGNLLHMVRMPFTGAIMSSLGCIICLVGASFIGKRQRFPIFYIGIIALIVRSFLLFGAFKPNILFSMFVEVVLMQFVVSLFGNNLLGSIVSGIMANIAPYVATFIFYGLLFGSDMLLFYHHLIKNNEKIAHFFAASGFMAATVVSSFLLVNGVFTGFVANHIRKKITHANFI